MNRAGGLCSAVLTGPLLNPGSRLSRRQGRVALLAACAALSGCSGAYDAHQARIALPGMTVPDLEACAGIPVQVKQGFR